MQSARNLADRIASAASAEPAGSTTRGNGTTPRVAVIGAGPCGLALLRAFTEAAKSGAELPELVCFEKQSNWAGIWNYTWRTGTDAAGDPVHGSMYRHLWSNAPKECLEFADYTFDEHFAKPVPSYPPREVLYDYIVARAQKSDIRKYIQFDTAVRWISHDAKKDNFSVTVEGVHTGEFRTEEFDYVVVASGHFSTPNVPDFPGFEQFPGRILHSHDFRDSREFAGQHLLVVGASYSAEDLALQAKKYGAASVTITYRTAPMGFDWPEGISEVPLLTHVKGSTAHFSDGSSRTVDAIVLCTGYRHHFPFVEDSLRLRTRNILYPENLYKGVFWVPNPKLMYLGMQDLYYTFTLFDAEAWYARDYILGRKTAPSAEEMCRDIASWRARQETVSSWFDAVDFQAEHMKDLLADVDYPKFDIELTRKHFHSWLNHKKQNIAGYRDFSGFTSPCTGTKSPDHHTRWWNAMDDSATAFLATGARGE
ncbi:hypothetical protein ACRALDRAFT_2029950 [Sodiomyces alcalophilus JCM 7366]|uniref:uncharacterized protein n=1 Tax=Sodiomyces alcalophilus JCM 7366 TaxID=591952 RepID=UPI0039B38A4A